MIPIQNIKQEHSSDLISLLITNNKYQDLMRLQIKKLNGKYPNPYLSRCFSTLDKKLLTIGPMSLCDNLASDLGVACSNQLLSAIGLSCLVISSHDDAVDEPPKNRSEIAALIYAGNIALLEAIKLFIDLNELNTVKYLIDTINQNHFYQQFRVDLVWEKSPTNLKQYLIGIKDGQSLAMIGPICALSIANKTDLISGLWRFSNAYAIVLQLIDDIKETDEDIVSGYHSFALLERPPYTKSFKEIKINLIRAEKLLNPQWKNTRAQLNRLKLIAEKLMNFYGS